MVGAYLPDGARWMAAGCMQGGKKINFCCFVAAVRSGVCSAFVDHQFSFCDVIGCLLAAKSFRPCRKSTLRYVRRGCRGRFFWGLPCWCGELNAHNRWPNKRSDERREHEFSLVECFTRSGLPGSVGMEKRARTTTTSALNRRQGSLCELAIPADACDTRPHVRTLPQRTYVQQLLSSVGKLKLRARAFYCVFSCAFCTAAARTYSTQNGHTHLVRVHAGGLSRHVTDDIATITTTTTAFRHCRRYRHFRRQKPAHALGLPTGCHRKATAGAPGARQTGGTGRRRGRGRSSA